MNRRSFIKTGLIYVPTAAIVPACLADRRRAQFQQRPIAGGGGSNTFITSYTPGSVNTVANVGYKITVGASNISVTELGSFAHTVGFTSPHVVKIYSAGSTEIASANVDVSAYDGTFKYTTLGSPVVLTSGQSYIVLRTSFDEQETNATPTVTSDATMDDAAYGAALTDLQGFGAGHGSIGPNFKYTV